MPKPGERTPATVKAVIRGMPTPTEVFGRSVKELGYGDKDPEWLQRHAEDVLRGLMSKGEEILRAEQRTAKREIAAIADAIEDDDERYDLIEASTVSFRNQMMKRAGVHMELSSAWLLTRSGIPNENGQEVTGRSDRVCPSMDVYRDRPELCAILEFKRTVRERWKEVRDEISKAGHSVWLVTLDDSIGDSLAKQIVESNIVLYVPQDVFAKLEARRGLRSIKTLITDVKRVIGNVSQTTLG